jgi:two-component system sensor histidine kinase DesK
VCLVSAPVLQVDPTVLVPRRPRYAWLWASIWLVYAYYPVREAWEATGPRRYLGLAALAVFVATYLLAFIQLPTLMYREGLAARGGEPVPGRLRAFRLGLAGLAATLAVIITALLGEENLPVFVYVAVLAMVLLPVRSAWLVVLALLIGTFAAQALVPGWRVDYTVQFQIFVAGMAMWAVTQIIARNRALAFAQEEIARLAAEHERNRLARDLHDILGHSLTVVAVKAELAGRLVRLDPVRAEAEITEVERLARGALGEVRAAVAGYREVTLSTELANARIALAAAGIDADLPTAIDDVPPERRTLFGWVVREAVTNVIRHSGASRCQVRITPSTVEIRDDGQPGHPSTVDLPVMTDDATVRTGESKAGHGLAGLRERAEAVGGTLRAGRTADGGYALAVTL